MVSDKAVGAAPVVELMVRVAVPAPVSDAGLMPPSVTPAGNPKSVVTLRATVPLNPLRGVTVMLNVADPPGMTDLEAGNTAMSKSGVGGKTVMVRIGGLGSELPLAFRTVREVTYSPGVANTTFPGTCAVEVAGDPPGKIQEYWDA